MTSGEGDQPDVSGKIVKQIEYYFGDVNLMKDKFLKEQIQEDDGWVSIETMLKFNRLREITEDQNVICEALKKSDLMEVNGDKNKIRRDPTRPLPGDTKERRDDLNARSIYAKSFPTETSLDDLMIFFEKYGGVENIFMRRNFQKKTFKGSVFVLFQKKEDAEKFVKEEDTKYNDEELIKKFKVDYYKDKADDKRKRSGGKKEETKIEEVTKDEEEDEEEKAKQQMTKNAVLLVKGMDPETTREDVRNFFQDFSPVGWVDFDKGVTEGYLRLKEPDSASSTVEKAKEAGDGKIIIREKEVEVKVVEGEEELEYWKKMFKSIAERHKNKKKDFRQGGGRNFRGGKRGRGGGGYHGKRRGGGGRDADEPRQKAAKTES